MQDIYSVRVCLIMFGLSKDIQKFEVNLLCGGISWITQNLFSCFLFYPFGAA